MGRDESALFSYSPWRRPALVLGAALVLALAHLAFRGPVAYVAGRWPSTRAAYWSFYAYAPPLPPRPTSGPAGLYYRYLDWWYDLGDRHSGRVYGAAAYFNSPNRTAIPK